MKTNKLITLDANKLFGFQLLPRLLKDESEECSNNDNILDIGNLSTVVTKIGEGEGGPN